MKKQVLNDEQYELVHDAFEDLVSVFEDLEIEYGTETKIWRKMDQIMSHMNNFLENYRPTE